MYMNVLIYVITLKAHDHNWDAAMELENALVNILQQQLLDCVFSSFCRQWSESLSGGISFTGRWLSHSCNLINKHSYESYEVELVIQTYGLVDDRGSDKGSIPPVREPGLDAI